MVSNGSDRQRGAIQVTDKESTRKSFIPTVEHLVIAISWKWERHEIREGLRPQPTKECKNHRDLWQKLVYSQQRIKPMPCLDSMCQDIFTASQRTVSISLEHWRA